MILIKKGPLCWSHDVQPFPAWSMCQASVIEICACIVLQPVPTMSGHVDNAVLDRMAKIMSYMRVSAGKPSKKGKKKDKLAALHGITGAPGVNFPIVHGADNIMPKAAGAGPRFPRYPLAAPWSCQHRTWDPSQPLLPLLPLPCLECHHVYSVILSAQTHIYHTHNVLWSYMCRMERCAGRLAASGSMLHFYCLASTALGPDSFC